jgi:hypothetical protein
MKNLEDAAKGYSIALGALEQTQKRHNQSGGIDINDIQILNETQKITDKIKVAPVKIYSIPESLPLLLRVDSITKL